MGHQAVDQIGFHHPTPFKSGLVIHQGVSTYNQFAGGDNNGGK